MSVLAALAAASVWRLQTQHVVGEEDPSSLLAGFRATTRTPGPRVMVLAIAAYYIVIGAIDVLSVVIAVELLGKSESYSGFLATAVGVGSAHRGRRRADVDRPALDRAVDLDLRGVDRRCVRRRISLAESRAALVIVVFVAFGVATTTFELTALMLLQHVSRLDLLGHVFSLVESLQMAMLAVGRRDRSARGQPVRIAMGSCRRRRAVRGPGRRFRDAGRIDRP